MSIAGIISANHQARVQSQVATAVTRKSLDVSQHQGKAIISLLESARQTQQQTLQPQESGKGLELDVQG